MEGENVKIQFLYKKQLNTLEIKNFFVLYGANQSGKSQLMDLFCQGFQGKLKNSFLLDGKEVEKNEFHVLQIGEYQSFLDEMKLGTKSFIKNQIEERIENISDKIMNLKNELSISVKDELLSKFEFIQNVDFEFDIKLNDLIFKNISFNTNSSFSNLRKLLIKTKLYQLPQKIGVLIIDYFDLGLSNYERDLMIKFLKNYSKENEITIIVSTSNFIDFESSSTFLYQDKVYQNVKYLYSKENLLNITKEDQKLYLEEELYEMYEELLKKSLKDIIKMLEKTTNNT